MAFPVVHETLTQGFSGATAAHEVSMPAVTVSGNLILVLFVSRRGTITTPAGWPAPIAYAAPGGAGSINFGLYGLEADGTEGGTTVDFVTSTADRAAAVVHQIYGWDGTIADDIDVSSSHFSGGSDSPDPSSVTAGWGGSEDNLFLVAIGAADDDVTLSALPTNYGNLQEVVSGGGTNAGASAHTCRRELAADTDNPGTATLSASQQEVAFTIVIRPGSSGSAPGGSNTLSAESGSIELTGSAAELNHGRSMAADSDSYDIVGNVANLVSSKIMAADAEAYSLSGANAEFGEGAYIAAESDSYIISGAVADLVVAKIISADSAAYALTGTIAALDRSGYTLAAETEVYDLIGTVAGILRGAYFLAEMGVIQQSADDVQLRLGVLMSMDSGSYDLTGAAVVFAGAITLVADADSYLLTGTVVDFLRGERLIAESAAYLISGTDIVLDTSLPVLSADPGSYDLAGAAAGIYRGAGFAGVSGAYALTGSLAILERALIVIGGAGSYFVSGTAVAMPRGVVVVGNSGVYLLSGTEAALAFVGVTDYTIIAQGDAYILTGMAVSFLRDAIIPMSSGSYAYSGSVADLSQSIGFPVDSGAYTINGANAALQRALRMAGLSGSYLISGANILLPYSGDIVIGRKPGIRSTSKRRSIIDG